MSCLSSFSVLSCTELPSDFTFTLPEGATLEDVFYSVVEIGNLKTSSDTYSLSFQGVSVTISDLGSFSRTRLHSESFSLDSGLPNFIVLPPGESYLSHSSIECGESMTGGSLTVNTCGDLIVLSSTTPLSGIFTYQTSYYVRRYVIYAASGSSVSGYLFISSGGGSFCTSLLGVKSLSLTCRYRQPVSAVAVTLAFYDVCSGVRVTGVTGSVSALELYSSSMTTLPSYTFSTGSSFHASLTLVPGRYRLSASASGYLSTDEDFIRNEIFEVPLPPGASFTSEESSTS